MTADSPEPEGNKRNVIVGYQTLADIQVKLARVETLLEGQSDNQTLLREEGDKRHADHELRLRVLEMTVTSGKDTKAAITTTWLFVWGAMIALANMAIPILTHIFTGK